MRRNKFSLSHYRLQTMDMGVLYPLTWFNVNPSETVQMSTSCLIRLLELNTPVMHPVRARIHHWFVPYRTIWKESSQGAEDGFRDFITGGEDGTATPTHPYVADTAVAKKELEDYMGIPAETFGYTGNFNALPFRAFNDIWNYNYRDQQLGSERTVDRTDGQDTTTTLTLPRVSWEKDYFTTCRTDDGLGTDPTIPLTGYAPVTGIGKTTQIFNQVNKTVYETDGSTPTYSIASFVDGTAGGDQEYVVEGDHATTGKPIINADLNAAAAYMQIGDWKTALAEQRVQELRNIYGSRYEEYVRQTFGVRGPVNPDRPVFLGGGRATINFSEAMATDGTNAGDLYGHGIAALKTRKWRKFFNEHGLVMTVISIVPKAVYKQALHRKWLKTTKEDYFMPEYQLVGEQTVTNKEAQIDHGTPDGVFGYQERYSEEKTEFSTVAGDFNDSSLNTYHMARDYSGDIALNSTWQECNPTTRIYKATAAQNVLCMANHSIVKRSPMMKNPTGRAF